jgi:hypothetical protein
MKDILQPLIDEFMPFAQKRMGFEKPPRVFLRDDPRNAQDPLGKTAYYDPEQMSVTLYIHGRHPKDVMRSLSHELVHHMQNCNGQFENTGDMGEGYAQSDPHLREMERQAYEIGNLCLRDWTDTRNSTIYNVSLQEGAKKKMSLKDWKNNELRTVLSERWGFSFNLLNESQEEEVVEEAAEDETLNEEEEELDEGGAANRMGDPRVRRQDPDRLREEEELDEEAKKMVKCGDKGMVPDYACDGKGSGDLKSGGAEEKETSEKPKMNEAQIRSLVRRLVKEAMAKKAK